MPAIGSYRGCDSCREWKKKCSSSRPGQTCSRCRTRNITCVGAGQQRFKFKTQSSTSPDHGSRHSQHVSKQFAAASPPAPCHPKSPLCNNNNSRIVSTLVYYLGSSHPGYNLKPFRLSMFEQLPQRVGYSVALDASLAAFTSLLEAQKSPFEQVNPKSLQLYTSGLKALQSSLSNPTAKYLPDTLCAAHILSECRIWMVRSADIFRGHSEGLAYLMSVLACQKPKDSFLLHTCFAVTANLLQDSVFNANIQLHPWIQNLFGVRSRRSRPSEDMQAISRLPGCDLRVFAMIPDLIRHPKENKERIQWAYNSILDQYLQTKIFTSANVGKLSWNTHDGWRCNEQHGMFIAIGVTLNAVLRALYPSNMLLTTEQAMFCADAIILAERAKQERPLAAHHVPQAIVSAWCVAADSKTKQMLRQLIEDYRTTYAMAKLVQHILYWPAAPRKLRDIPWFTLYRKKGGTETAYTLNTGETTKVDSGMDEFCCIL